MVANPAFGGRIPSNAEFVIDFANSSKGNTLLEHGTSIELLHFALGLCKEEFRALHHGYVDIAAANNAVRSELLRLAWDRRQTNATGNEIASLRKAYEDMEQCQKDLVLEAQSLQLRMRAKINKTKQAGARIHAYKKGIYATQ